MEELMLCKTFNDRNKNIIIGLTGRTGVGCSTTANILSEKQFERLSLREPKRSEYANAEERKYKIIYDYFGGENASEWIPFKVIKISNVILQIILENGLDRLTGFIENLNQWNLYIENKAKLLNELRNLNNYFDTAKRNRDQLNSLSLIISKETWDEEEISELEKLENFYLKTIPNYRKTLETIMGSYMCHYVHVSKKEGKKQERNDLLKVLFQFIGNNIRSSGDPYSGSFDEKNEYLYRTLDLLIDCITLNNEVNSRQTRICIDAIRNPFESLFLKRRHANYYTMAISAQEDIRIERLERKNFNLEEIHSLDNIENPARLDGREVFFHQNVKGCIENADIHIDNSKEEKTKFYLTEQVIRYVVLMNHPGLIMPTPVERCMQIAYNARLNSGCLSRQVGSVITDQNYSIKAVGWNEVPEGQVSCALRDIRTYSDKDIESYSKYELNNYEFEETVFKLCKLKKNRKLFGLPLPYCFKDIKMGLDKKQNQVHTRALHAEENAFLQIVKYGGEGILGGKLFVTTSPCELCSKKSYQLGIQEIYYIDYYSGISREHILSFGESGNPHLILYNGAIGAAYEKLYSRIIPLKDELELITQINDKTVARDLYVDERISNNIKSVEYIGQSMHLIFHSRCKIECIRQTSFRILDPSVKRLFFGFGWTGNIIEGVESRSEEWRVTNVENLNNKCTFEVELLKEHKEGDIVTAAVQIDLRDDKREMESYLSFAVSKPMEKLELALSVNNEDLMVENVVLKKYYDFAGNKSLGVPIKITGECVDGCSTYIYSTDNQEVPIVNYTYSLEWDEVRK